MIYALLLIALLGFWLVIKLAAGVIRLVLIVVLLLILAGVAVGTREEAVPVQPTATEG